MAFDPSTATLVGFDPSSATPVDAPSAGAGRGFIAPTQNEFARGNASRGIIASAQQPTEDLTDPYGMSDSMVDRAPKESVLQGTQMPAPQFDPVEAEKLSNRAYAQSTQHGSATSWDGKSGRIIAPEPDADVNPNMVDKTLGDISQSFASGARHVGRQFGEFADIAGSALDPTMSAADRANVARDYQLNRVGDQQDYVPTTAAGTTVHALTNMAPMFIPGVGADIGAMQMSMGAMQGASEEGHSDANVYAKGVANMALGGDLGHFAASSTSMLLGKLPFLSKAMAPAAADTLESMARGVNAQGHAMAAGFYGAQHGFDALIDAVTGETNGKTMADYFGHGSYASDVAPMLFTSLVSKIPSYRNRNVMGEDGNAFTTTENGVSKVYLGHSDGTLFTSPDAAKSAYNANPDLFSQPPQVTPITEQAINPKSQSNKVLGFALDVTPTIQDAAEATAHAAVTAARNQALYNKSQQATPQEKIAAAPDVDTAIAAATSSLPPVKAPDIKSQMSAIRPLMPTESVDRVTYPTAEEALSDAKAQGVDAIPVATDNGFVLAPPPPKESVGDLNNQSLAVSDLGRALPPPDRPELVTGTNLFDGATDDSGRASIQRASDTIGLISNVTQSLWGWKPIVIRGLESSFGVTYNGNAYVDIDNIAKSETHSVPTLATYAITHELGHLYERSNDPQDKADWSVFHKVALSVARESTVAARTREEAGHDDARGRGEREMTADMSAFAMKSPQFWQKMYDMDNGSTMRRIAYKFMQVATQFMKAVKGSRQDAKVLFKGDTAAQIQQNINTILDAAATAWSNRALRQGRNVGVSKAKTELFDEPPQMARKGVVAEVAPHPGDEEGDQEMRDRAQLTKNWNSLSDQEKLSATRGIGRKVLDHAQHITGQKGWDVEFSSGTFEGKTNPNMILHAPEHATPEDIDEMTRVVGHMLDQKAMISFDESNTTGDNQATFVKVDLPKGFTPSKIEALREHLRQHGYDGDTLRDGGLYFGNFGDASDEDFHAGIDAALKKFDSTDTFGTSRKRFESGYFEPENREAYLEGTHYGNSDTTRASTGGDVLRRRQGRDTLERVGQEIAAQRKQWTDSSPAGRAEAAALRHRLARSSDSGQGAPSYGEPREGSVSAVGVHYSQKPRSLISSEYVGTGLKGADNKRFDLPENQDIRHRINFYVDNGNGIHPEAGVGGVAHKVNLHNLYDVAADPLGLVKNMKGATEQERVSNFERSIKDAGFAGYLANKDSGHQDYAVLLGKHAIRTEAPQHARYDDYPSSIDDINDLGNFDLDRFDEGIEKHELTDAEIADKIKAELLDKIYGVQESKNTPASAKTVDFGAVKDKDIKAQGLHPENAYPDLEYQEHANGGKFARFKTNGQDYVANVKDTTSPNLTSHTTGNSPVKDMDRYARGNAIPHGMQKMTEQAKMEWNKRFAAQADLLRRRFDLYTAVPADARERVADVWNKIAKNPEAFEYAKDVKPSGKNLIEVAQSIADKLLQGGRYEIKAAPLGPDERAFYGDGVTLHITDTKTGETSEAAIQFDPTDREVVMHTQNLEKGSGAGKPVYQIGQLFASAFRSKIKADPQGLLGVNNYRRTEQMFSGMLRSGKPETMQPGIGQRIYGWNERATKPEHHERNMVRTALAITRNVNELAPQAERLSYDLNSGKFYLRDKGDTPISREAAEARVQSILSDKDARAMSLSRSTLARAAITNDAIHGKSEVPSKIDEPVLYARKDGPNEFRYQDNYLVPEMDEFRGTHGAIASLPALKFKGQGFDRSFPAMPVRIRVGEHGDNVRRTIGDRPETNYGLQHRIENQQESPSKRGYATPDVGSESHAQAERAARDIAASIHSAKTVYVEGNAKQVTLWSPDMGRITVLKRDVDSEGKDFWSVKTSVPKDFGWVSRNLKSPTPLSGTTEGLGTQQSQSISNARILEKLQEPGTVPRSSESYIIDQDGKLIHQDVAPAPQAPAKVLARDANGKIILNKNKPQMARQDDTELGARLDSVKSHMSDMLDNMLDPVYKFAAPMSSGTEKTRAVAQDWINNQRKANWEWNRLDAMIANKFTKEQRAKMWDAADEQNELLATGQDTTGKGLDRLSPEERGAVEQLHSYGEELLQRAKDVGMFKGEGVPYWTPRMMALINDEGEYVKPSSGQTASSDGRGRNFTSTSSNLKQRKYLSSVDTEEAMMHKGGVLVHDIRTMPLAMGKLEKAIAGRELINQIKALGKVTGEPTVSDSKQDGFFTIDHPSFMTYRPRLEEKDGTFQAVKDKDGNTIMEKHPLYISKDFEGPLKAILSEKNGPIYQGYMTLKSKAMSAIMFSPLIHNQVILGRALAYGKLKTPLLYFTGHTAKQDPDFMRKMIGSGMVPIGEHSNMLDVGDLARDQAGDLFEPTIREKLMDPNESWIGLGGQKVLNYLPGDLKLGDKFKSGLDSLGDFWHNTLLWNRVGDLQAGIAQDVYHKLLKQGVSDQDASTVAAHIANRYAGAIGRENMSQAMHKFFNVMLFSKSFNMGNIGTVKDAFYGMPAGLRAQMFERGDKESLEKALQFAKSKARWGLVTDLAATILVTSLVQNLFKDDKRGYMGRAQDMLEQIKQHPGDATSYNPYRMSSTWGNEPDKRDRVDMGAQPNGRHEYMRLPTGKVVEDIIGWTMHPFDTAQKKLSPLASSIEGLAQNAKDKYGTPIWNPDSSVLQRAFDVAKFFVGKHIPLDQINTSIDIMNGKGTQLDKDKIAGNWSGLTVSQGHPRGPEGAVAQATEDRTNAAKKYVMEAVKSDIKYGRDEKAYQRLIDIGLTPREANKTINNLENPRSTLSGQQRKKFNAHATEQERADMSAVE